MRSMARWWAGFVITGWVLVAAPARAGEAASVDPAPATADAHAIERASDLTQQLVDPANGGVAGTGLGTMPADDKTGAGSGRSVKGPAGAGVDPTAPKPNP